MTDTVENVGMKEYFTAILAERTKASEQAGVERDRASLILREAFLTHIRTGDEALSRHIHEQIAQVHIIIKGRDALIAQSAETSQRAIQKAEDATERRLALLNEFRAQAAEESRKFLPNNVYMEKHKALTDRVDKVEGMIAKMIGGIAVVACIGVANLVKLWFTTTWH